MATYKYHEVEVFDVPLSRVETIGKGERRRYPFEMLEVGQAFAITKLCNRQSLASSASKYGARHGKRFIIRKIDGGPCCIRVA